MTLKARPPGRIRKLHKNANLTESDQYTVGKLSQQPGPGALASIVRPRAKCSQKPANSSRKRIRAVPKLIRCGCVAAIVVRQRGGIRSHRVDIAIDGVDLAIEIAQIDTGSVRRVEHVAVGDRWPARPLLRSVVDRSVGERSRTSEATCWVTTGSELTDPVRPRVPELL